MYLYGEYKGRFTTHGAIRDVFVELLFNTFSIFVLLPLIASRSIVHRVCDLI